MGKLARKEVDEKHLTTLKRLKVEGNLVEMVLTQEKTVKTTAPPT